MNAQKENRIKFLRALYDEATKAHPSSPASIWFGLAKTRRYNVRAGEFINNDEERGGYIIGEQLGLTPEEVEAAVGYYASNEVHYLDSTMGMMQCSLTQEGIMYVESLEEMPPTAIQVQHNFISIGDINAPVQFQQGSVSSNQSQTVDYSGEDIRAFFMLLEKDLTALKIEIQQDLKSEIDYCLRQLNKGKSVKTQLGNIGNLMKDVGINVFANVLASPIYEFIKPLLGI